MRKMTLEMKISKSMVRRQLKNTKLLSQSFLKRTLHSPSSYQLKQKMRAMMRTTVVNGPRMMLGINFTNG